MSSNKKLRKEEIKHKLAELDKYLLEIEEYLPSDEEDFLHSGIKKHGIYKLAESAIEEVIKMCTIINSDLRFGIPSDEDSIIKNLSDNKILSEVISKKIIEMKGFRNILIHRYGKIDDKLAFHNITENLEDFNKFKEERLRFLKKY